jgi:hypothetical protein
VALCSGFGLAAVLLHAGCSSDNAADQPLPGVDAGQGGAAEDAGHDAAPDADAEPDADASGPLTSEPLLLSSGIFGAGANTNIWFIGTTAQPGERCHIDHVGACYILNCWKNQPSDPAPHWVSLGTIELKRGADVLLTATPMGDGAYPTTSQPGALWSPGDNLTLVTSGGDVPAFSQDWVGPDIVTVLSPLPDGGPSVDVHKTSPLVVMWEPVSGGVTVTASQMNQGPEPFDDEARFLCEFDGQAGTGTIPVEALAPLKLSADWNGVTSFNVGGNQTFDVQPGGYSIHVHVVNTMLYHANVLDP